jgi:hypothetical protein
MNVNLGVAHNLYSVISLGRSSRDLLKIIVLLKHLLINTSLYILGPGGMAVKIVLMKFIVLVRFASSGLNCIF